MSEDQERKEYEAYLASQKAPPNDDAAEYAEYQKYVQSQQSPTGKSAEQAKLDELAGQHRGDSTIGKVGHAIVDGGLRAADWLGGVGRTAAMQVADDARWLGGKEMLLTDEDRGNAVKGKAIPTQEYLDRMGVPKGSTLSDVAPGLYSEDGNGFPLQKGGWADPSVRGAAGFVGDVVTDPLTYLSMGTSLGAKAAGKAGQELTMSQRIGRTLLNPVESTMQGTGKAIYKSGLKRIDQEALKYGKEPVSDLLLKEGVWGSAEGIQRQMDTLGERLLSERDAALQAAKERGVEVSMQEAMAPSRARVAQIRASQDPNLQPLADALEKKIKEYEVLDRRAGYTPIEVKPKEWVKTDLPVQGEMTGGHTPIEVVPGNQIIGELPVQAKYQNTTQGLKESTVQGGEFVPQKAASYFEEVAPQIKPGPTVPDQFVQKKPVTGFYEEPTRIIPGKTVPDMPGVDPVRASGFKTTAGASIPDSAYQMQQAGPINASKKEMQGGLREAIEQALEKDRTGSGKELKELNDKLGRILTTKEKQAMEAAKEGNKNLVTSVDPMVAIGMGPWAYAGKKAADIAKLTRTRTGVGKLLNRTGVNSLGLVDEGARRTFWELMREKQNEQYQTPIEGY